MIRYMIIEDEYILGHRLERMISKICPSWTLSCRTAGVEESVEALRSHEVDLIFMDIELSDGSCFEIFDSIEVLKPVIFTTAYDDYALAAFRAYSIDYLLKPVGQDDLLRAVEKFERVTAGSPPPDYRALKEQAGRGKTRDRILIPQGSGYVFINVSDAAWFIRSDRYTDITTLSGQHHLIDQSLDSLEEELDSRIFFRASRHCIINISAIVSIQRFSNGRLRIITNPPSETDILVSQARREDFLSWIEGCPQSRS